MTAILDSRPAAPAPATTAVGVNQRRVIRAEWIKLRSIRSRLLTLLIAGGVVIALGALFASFASRQVGNGRPADSLSLSLGGFGLAQLIVGVLGVMVVSGEYSSGLIRTTFSAVPRRLPVLWAKALVFATVTAAAMIPAAFGAYFAGRATYNGALPAETLGSPGVLRAVIGAGLYAAGIGAIGVAVGFLVRSTGFATGALFAGLLVVPPLTELLPTSISNVVTKLMPSNAGLSFATVHPTDGALSPFAGLGVFLVWIAGFLLLAAIALRRRDA